MKLKNVCSDCNSIHEILLNENIENIDIIKLPENYILKEKQIIYLPEIWNDKGLHKELHKGKIIKIHSDNKFECVFYCIAFARTFLTRKDIYIKDESTRSN